MITLTMLKDQEDGEGDSRNHEGVDVTNFPFHKSFRRWRSAKSGEETMNNLGATCVI